MRNTSGTVNGSHGSRTSSDQRAALAAYLSLGTPQKIATPAAAASANTHSGGSNPILWPVSASVTASAPKDNQSATAAPIVVMKLATDCRITAAYVKRMSGRWGNRGNPQEGNWNKEYGRVMRRDE
jgi:hypothetical protein